MHILKSSQQTNVIKQINIVLIAHIQDFVPFIWSYIKQMLCSTKLIH